MHRTQLLPSAGHSGAHALHPFVPSEPATEQRLKHPLPHGTCPVGVSVTAFPLRCSQVHFPTRCPDWNLSCAFPCPESETLPCKAVRLLQSSQVCPVTQVCSVLVTVFSHLPCLPGPACHLSPHRGLLPPPFPQTHFSSVLPDTYAFFLFRGP